MVLPAGLVAVAAGIPRAVLVPQVKVFLEVTVLPITWAAVEEVALPKRAMLARRLAREMAAMVSAAAFRVRRLFMLAVEAAALICELRAEFHLAGRAVAAMVGRRGALMVLLARMV